MDFPASVPGKTAYPNRYIPLSFPLHIRCEPTVQRLYGCFQKWWYPKMDGLQWKTLLKWMIWGAHPYFWKHPYKQNAADFEHLELAMTGNMQLKHFSQHFLLPRAVSPRIEVKEVSLNRSIFKCSYGTLFHICSQNGT